MAGTRSLKPNMSPRSSGSQIRKVPTVDNAARVFSFSSRHALLQRRASRGCVGRRSGHTELRAARCRRSVSLHRQVP